MKNLLLLLLLFTSVLCLHQSNAQSVHQLSSNSYVKEFLIGGPFHQNGLKPGDYINLLEIELIENENLFGTGTNKIGTVVAKVGSNNAINFNEVLGDSAVALAYAHFKISTPEVSKALFIISAADGAKVYINGVNVHTGFGGGDNFYATLKQGENNVVIKVPNRAWNWDLSVKVLEEEKANEYHYNINEKSEFLQFLNSNLEPQLGVDPRFRLGRFPELAFDKPGLVRKYLGGGYSISTRWFDSDLAEVLYPKKPGRYAYYAKVVGKNGITLKKSATLFCSEDWKGGLQRLNARLNYIPGNGISESTWNAHQQAIGDYAGFDILNSIRSAISKSMTKEVSVLLAFVDQMNKKQLQPGPLNTPLIVDGDYHAQLKQKILGVENNYPKLKLPAITGKKAPVLKKLSDAQAKKYKDLTSELEQACNEWIVDEGAPFDMLLAKDGDIIFKESFGEDDYGKFTTETPTEIASVTKLLTGMLFAQFVDQGIIGIDDPVGKYLPDFPLTGPTAVTLRHCFTHTNGFYGHGLFDGVHNPWLENTLALVIKDDTVGMKHSYNGMGYDLAGKVMEVVTGKSIFRLFQEYLYDPLEMNNTIHDLDLGFSCNSTAFDLAKVAQLILNKGTYGDKQFFSEETYEKLIPTDLSEFYPGVDMIWGIGFNIKSNKVRDKKTGEDHSLLSKDIIGHGSATSTIFWVDLEHNIVVTQSRRGGKRHFIENLTKVTEVIEKYLTN